MNPGPGPDDPQGTPGPPDTPSSDDQDLEWTAWRQGPGYSTPVPPEPEPRSGSPKAGSHEKPPPKHPYTDRVPNQTSGTTPERRDDFWAPRRPAEAPSSYRPPEVHEDQSSYEPQRSDPERRPYAPPYRLSDQGRSFPAPSSSPEQKAYQAPSSYEEPGTYEVPKPRPYVSTTNFDTPSSYGGPGDAGDLKSPDDLGNHGEPGSHADLGSDLGDYGDLGSRDDLSTTGEPDSYDEPGSYEGPIDYRPDDADSGPRDEDEDFNRRFWSEGRGGGAHASPPGPSKTPAPSRTPPPATPYKAPTPSRTPPPPPGDTSIYRSPPPRRQLGFLVAAAAVVVIVAVAAVLVLTHHSPGHHPAASGGSSPKATNSASAPPASTPPPSTGASGRLGVPGSIGALLFDQALTNKFVGPSVRQQDANSFFIPYKDVVSGFYTPSPTATKYSADEPRLMFLVVYLAGAGNAKSALHEFMTNHTFTNQQQVNPGSQGGEAACGLLPQQPTPVAHCMWADGNTYADFYAWNSSPSALAKTMITIRPQVELTHS
jgi:hypothetical protein